MKKYYCECCMFSSKLKSDYERHLGTKKHLKCIQNVSQNHQKVTP